MAQPSRSLLIQAGGAPRPVLSALLRLPARKSPGRHRRPFQPPPRPDRCAQTISDLIDHPDTSHISSTRRAARTVARRLTRYHVPGLRRASHRVRLPYPVLLCDPFQGGTDGWKDPQSYRAAKCHIAANWVQEGLPNSEAKKDPPIAGRGAQKCEGAERPVDFDEDHQEAGSGNTNGKRTMRRG